MAKLLMNGALKVNDKAKQFFYFNSQKMKEARIVIACY
jgi:hypothetical protein